MDISQCERKSANAWHIAARGEMRVPGKGREHRCVW